MWKLLIALGFSFFVLGCDGKEQFAFEEPQDQLKTDPDALRRAKIFEMYSVYKKEAFPSAEDLTPEEFSADRAETVLVDVRTARERKISLLPGAITKAEFEERREEFKDKLIVSYCTIGFRSGVYTVDLGKRGFRAKKSQRQCLTLGPCRF